MDSLGDRMKNNYENVSRIYLLKRIPVIIRIDGKSFHTFTKNFEKPFDHKLMDIFQESIINTIPEIQGFKLAYSQSDEVSFLLTDFDALETEAWFNYNKSKIESVTSSMFSTHFNLNKHDLPERYIKYSFHRAFFDARSFNIPKEEVTNYFLWRAKDWLRNSIQMYARSLFSHKELINKNSSDIHEMLHSIGKNWCNDLSDREKNGTFILKDKNGNINVLYNILPTYESINSIVENLIYMDK